VHPSVSEKYDVDSIKDFQDAWVAQSVERPTLDPGSCLDLRVMSSNPVFGSMLGVKPTLKNFSNIKMLHIILG